MTEAEFLRACRANSSGDRSSTSGVALVAAFVAAVMAGLLTSLAMGPLPAVADQSPVAVVDARQSYRGSIWGFWRGRRTSAARATQALSTQPPLHKPRAEPAAVRVVSSIDDVSATVRAASRPPASLPILAPPPSEISQPSEVRRLLAAMGPDAAGRLAAADAGMRLVLQVGSFVQSENAHALELRLARSYAGVYTSRYDHHGRVFHRVRIAQFAGSEQLDAVENSLRANGYDPLRILTGERPDLASHRR